MKLQKLLLTGMLTGMLALHVHAQSELYPKHFDLEQVTLLDGPMKTAMEKNFEKLMQYDVDRLLTPFIRQAGLAATTNAESMYYQWAIKHPNFTNWGDASFDLSGHVGGHYLSALSLAYAACHETNMKARLKERMDYMVQVLKDCQDQYNENTTGLYGFIGGQPINSDWEALYAGNIQPYKNHGGWVPFYCQHKILAGLRDAFLYGNNETAKELFRKLADWSVNVIAKVSDADMKNVLDTEHGGMNESMLDAYQLFDDEKYLNAAKKYTHETMLNGMQSLNTTFLDGKHANTQVPKYIGMERIGEVLSPKEELGGTYLRAAENFWEDVTQNRTVCIGGNSVNEHFLSKSNSNRYIDQLDGPESCNTNNMLKLSEMMFDHTSDAKYVDFYENAMWNHILSTQDPETGGYVYFTTLRPQGYRIYSQVNQGMWCCVGTGMENHSKYGHFIYTHDGTETLYVNLFTPSHLGSDNFIITQETRFPNEPKTTLTIGKAGHYTIAIRRPNWTTEDFCITINGTKISGLSKGSYIHITRTWSKDDCIEIKLPMTLRYETCPNYTDYIAFKYGPILLGAEVSSTMEGNGLPVEKLQNEYGGEGRMDHAPGSRALSKNLTSAPLLIGERDNVLSLITKKNGNDLQFTIDASRKEVSSYTWGELTLQPFYQIHHSRYMCYWYQQSAENYSKSTMAQTEAANEALQGRTIDFVAPGEQQSEAGHEYNYSSDSNTGDYNTEHYRDAKANGYIQYTLYNNTGIEDSLSIMLRFNLADKGRKAILTLDGQKLADITVPASAKNSDGNGFFNVEYPIPSQLAKGKQQFVIRLTASSSTYCPGIYYVRLLKGYDNHAYRFLCTDWTTGDANRVSASNITYDTLQNIIHVKASGANNVALTMKYNDNDYSIAAEQIYLLVRGKNLRTITGSSYLWWLNGTNHGSQVAPILQKSYTIDDEEQQIIVWNMKNSGLYENFYGNRPNICIGQTIFGLTSKTDNSDIIDIAFTNNYNDYVSPLTGITSQSATKQSSIIYSLSGIQEKKHIKGINIANRQKVIF